MHSLLRRFVIAFIARHMPMPFFIIHTTAATTNRAIIW